MYTCIYAGCRYLLAKRVFPLGTGINSSPSSSPLPPVYHPLFLNPTSCLSSSLPHPYPLSIILTLYPLSNILSFSPSTPCLSSPLLTPYPLSIIPSSLSPVPYPSSSLPHPVPFLHSSGLSHPPTHYPLFLILFFPTPLSSLPHPLFPHSTIISSSSSFSPLHHHLFLILHSTSSSLPHPLQFFNC